MYVQTQITSIFNYYLQLLITSSFYIIPNLLMTLWQAWKMRFYSVVGAKQKSMNSLKREKMLWLLGILQRLQPTFTEVLSS